MDQTNCKKTSLYLGEFEFTLLVQNNGGPAKLYWLKLVKMK